MNTFSLRKHCVATISALLMGAAAGLVQAQYAQALPVRELSAQEQAVILGVSPLTSSALNLRVAATARVSAYGEATTPTSTERRKGSAAAVYAGTHGSHPALLPTWPTPGSGLMKFEDIGDHAQAWATVTAGGIPYLFVTGYGDFRAEATAAWNVTITVPAGGAGREVVARVVIPPVRVNGNIENQGRAYWRSRMRADLLVNGFPAWSTEAIRMTINPFEEVGKVILLQQFGAAMNFPSNDEDGVTTNDTENGSTEGPSAKQVVFLSLGRMPAGTVLEVSFSVRGTALTVPGDHCKRDSVRYFCSNATMTVRGDSGEMPLFFLMP